MSPNLWLLCSNVGLVLVSASAVRAQNVTPPVSPQTVLNKYCVTCHNAKLKTAGYLLDPSGLARAGDHAEMFEKAIRKLRAGTMPPPGLPRPDQATSISVAASLESELDRAAAVQPKPGRLPAMHRLSRTEYQNAVRDLLAVDALPKEMDYSLLLPADNASSGFDNLADLLFVSPVVMERYLGAAQKISALAVGDPSTPVMVNIFLVPDESPQDAPSERLPFGTRGGLAVSSTFPVDGEYLLRVEPTGKSRIDEQLEISVDGKRVAVHDIRGDASAVQRAGHPGEPKSNGPLEFRVPIKAGPRLIGIAFVEQNETRDEETLRPRMRGRGTGVALAKAVISGPYRPTGPGDTPSRNRIFVCRPAAANDELPCAKRILSTLQRRAYRRPVTDADLNQLLPFYQSGRKERDFDLGIQRALERLLVSPQFLFRIERNAKDLAPGQPYRISDLELSSRLSFFLWSSIPDDELLDVAVQGKLRRPDVLEHQVRRMLADSRSMSLVTNFAEQWLYLRDLDSKRPDELLFPDFDETLRDAFRQETHLFLDSVLRGNRTVLELLTANYTFLNERLAKHYGIPHVEGSFFRRVTLPEDSPRGGLLGQGSILTITSYATRTSPVVRGKWVLENLLSSAPPPPPPNIPALKTESNKTGKTLTMREAMVAHRANPACASCHSRMDPIGFATEKFDAVGHWRDVDNGHVIDTSGVFPDGTKFDGMSGMKKTLLLHPEEFVGTVAERLLMYAVGRNVQYFDRPALRSIVRDAARDNYTFGSLVLGVVNSAPFQMREAAVSSSSKDKQ